MQNTLEKKIDWFLKKNAYEIVLIFLLVLYIVYFTLASIARYNNFYTGRFDLGNMDQTVWNTSQGRIFQLTNPNGTDIISRLAFHADFFLILLSPFYLLWPDPKILLLLQTVVIGCGAVFVFLLAKDILKNKKIGLLFALLFLINPSVEHMNLYDFHAVTFATTFLLATFYFLQKRRYALFVFFALLSASTKEQIWIIVVLLGLYTIFITKKKILGLLMTIFSLFLFYYLVWHAIPTARGAKHFALSYYSDFGESPTAIIKNIIVFPQKTLTTILQFDRLHYILQLFLPVGFLSFFSPLTLIFLFPDLFINLLSNNAQLREIYFQYTAAITPFVFISGIFGLKTLTKIFAKIPLFYYEALLVIAAVVSAYLYGPLPGARNPNLDMFTKPQKDKTIITYYLAHIPKSQSVAATNNLGSHLSHREKIFTIPVGIDKADVIAFLLDDPFAQPSPQAQRKMVESLKKNSQYSVLFDNDEFILFQKIPN